MESKRAPEAPLPSSASDQSRAPNDPLDSQAAISPAALASQRPSGLATDEAFSTPQSLSASVEGSDWSYRTCSQARAAGAAPLYRGQPGYGSHLDRDNDGIACEPYRGR
ncbi:excalibur calcium-binding domain-containing protein [Sphingobium sp. CFD-1]|uniref:excalibur calcium-binding domain-containing protein n=1 Tax=Sphingobium sp. CFD-1 TaxID=2878545 RepID=UPI00214C807D|nr:excalibur calcium-binding domain-containing protein [Sphingobium sp. CFD-1]